MLVYLLYLISSSAFDNWATALFFEWKKATLLGSVLIPRLFSSKTRLTISPITKPGWPGSRFERMTRLFVTIKVLRRTRIVFILLKLAFHKLACLVVCSVKFPTWTMGRQLDHWLARMEVMGLNPAVCRAFFIVLSSPTFLHNGSNRLPLLIRFLKKVQLDKKRIYKSLWCFTS